MRLQLALQPRNSGPYLRLCEFQLRAPPLCVSHGLALGFLLFALALPARGAHQHLATGAVDIGQ